ncbi:BAF_HP2_G0030150.mRNA.1.CDS.1 [Saccharomyces cerevisiae]|nr:BAF_HP2_G0030150.mRNA.1.CDS.1 [Saccharomyces cerevisiae]CAI6455136.1 BAF_HP2_G0030150.mRNA.1.CDS.1 [Saccharomyces cerevisiae]
MGTLFQRNVQNQKLVLRKQQRGSVHNKREQKPHSSPAGIRPPREEEGVLIGSAKEMSVAKISTGKGQNGRKRWREIPEDDFHSWCILRCTFAV